TGPNPRQWPVGWNPATFVPPSCTPGLNTFNIDQATYGANYKNFDPANYKVGNSYPFLSNSPPFNAGNPPTLKSGVYCFDGGLRLNTQYTTGTVTFVGCFQLTGGNCVASSSPLCQTSGATMNFSGQLGTLNSYLGNH